MNIKAPKNDIKRIIVINIDDEIKKKICFRETLLISKSLHVPVQRIKRRHLSGSGGVGGGDVNEDSTKRGIDIDLTSSSDDVTTNTDTKGKKRKCLKPCLPDNLCVNVCAVQGEEMEDEMYFDFEEEESEPKERMLDVELAPSGDIETVQPDEQKVRILEMDDCSTTGGMVINIECSGGHLLLYASAQFGVDGQAAGGTILSTIDTNFTLIEEKKREYITRSNPDFIEEKFLHVSLDDDSYKVIKGHKGEDTYEKMDGVLTFEHSRDLLWDGAGLIMLRYLAVTNFRGKLELTTMLINGDIAKVIYRCSGYKKAWVNNKIRNVIKIEKNLIEKCGLVQNSLTIMTDNGFLVKHEWEDCDYVIHVNPLGDIPQDLAGLANNWENDIEMLSKYLDYKTKLKSEHKSFFKDQPLARAVVSDYLHYILLSKPKDILDYTIDYFKCLYPS